MDPYGMSWLNQNHVVSIIWLGNLTLTYELYQIKYSIYSSFLAPHVTLIMDTHDCEQLPPSDQDVASTEAYTFMKHYTVGTEKSFLSTQYTLNVNK